MICSQMALYRSSVLGTYLHVVSPISWIFIDSGLSSRI